LRQKNSTKSMNYLYLGKEENAIGIAYTKGKATFMRPSSSIE